MSRLLGYFLYVLGVFAAWGFWFGEILWMKGWPGLAWLKGFTWSSLPICALIVLMSSYAVATHVDLQKRAAFVGVGFLMAISSFLLVKYSAFELFSGGFPSGPAYGATLVMLFGWWILPVGLPLLASLWLGPLHRWAALLVAGALATTIPLSFATIKIFPALNGSTDQMHAFKMGYPVIWIAVLVPAAMRVARRRHLPVHTSVQKEKSSGDAGT
jgi:hypothetical protein